MMRKVNNYRSRVLILCESENREKFSQTSRVYVNVVHVIPKRCQKYMFLFMGGIPWKLKSNKCSTMVLYSYISIKEMDEDK